MLGSRPPTYSFASNEDVTIDTAAKQTVEMFAEIGADTIKRYGIDARIAVGQYEAENPKGVPEMVEILSRVGVEMKPHGEDVRRQEANGKEHDETLCNSRMTIIKPLQKVIRM